MKITQIVIQFIVLIFFFLHYLHFFLVLNIDIVPDLNNFDWCVTFICKFVNGYCSLETKFEVMIEPLIGDYQAGFRNIRGTMNQFIMKVYNERDMDDMLRV